MIMGVGKRFWFLLPQKGRSETDNKCKINFIVLILQSHDCRNWVDLASNFLHYLSNLFKKVFWSSNTRFFSSDKKKRFWCSTISSSSLYSTAKHASSTAFLTNHKHSVSVEVNFQIRLWPYFHEIKVSLSGFFLSSFHLDELIVDEILIDLSLFSVFTNCYPYNVSFVVKSSLLQNFD